MQAVLGRQSLDGRVRLHDEARRDLGGFVKALTIEDEARFARLVYEKMGDANIGAPWLRISDINLVSKHEHNLSLLIQLVVEIDAGLLFVSAASGAPSACAAALRLSYCLRFNRKCAAVSFTGADIQPFGFRSI